jgi:hypothetical protein
MFIFTAIDIAESIQYELIFTSGYIRLLSEILKFLFFFIIF